MIPPVAAVLVVIAIAAYVLAADARSRWPTGARPSCTRCPATTAPTPPCWRPARRWRCGRSGGCSSRSVLPLGGRERGAARRCSAQSPRGDRASPRARVRRVGRGPVAGRRRDAGDAGGRRLLRHAADLSRLRPARRRRRAGRVLRLGGAAPRATRDFRARNTVERWVTVALWLAARRSRSLTTVGIVLSVVFEIDPLLPEGADHRVPVRPAVEPADGAARRPGRLRPAPSARCRCSPARC